MPAGRHRMPQPRRSCQQCDQRVSCGGPAENLRSNRDRSGGLCRISGSRAAERHGAKPSISLRTANSPCCSTGRAMCCWRAARSRALSAVGACSRSPPCSALSCSGCSWLRAAACLAEREPGCRSVLDAGGRQLSSGQDRRYVGKRPPQLDDLSLWRLTKARLPAAWGMSTPIRCAFLTPQCCPTRKGCRRCCCDDRSWRLR